MPETLAANSDLVSTDATTPSTLAWSSKDDTSAQEQGDEGKEETTELIAASESNDPRPVVHFVPLPELPPAMMDIHIFGVRVALTVSDGDALQAFFKSETPTLPPPQLRLQLRRTHVDHVDMEEVQSYEYDGLDAFREAVELATTTFRVDGLEATGTPQGEWTLLHLRSPHAYGNSMGSSASGDNSSAVALGQVGEVGGGGGGSSSGASEIAALRTRLCSLEHLLEQQRATSAQSVDAEKRLSRQLNDMSRQLVSARERQMLLEKELRAVRSRQKQGSSGGGSSTSSNSGGGGGDGNSGSSTGGMGGGSGSGGSGGGGGNGSPRSTRSPRRGPKGPLGLIKRATNRSSRD